MEQVHSAPAVHWEVVPGVLTKWVQGAVGWIHRLHFLSFQHHLGKTPQLSFSLSNVNH